MTGLRSCNRRIVTVAGVVAATSGCLPIPYYPAFGPEARDYSDFTRVRVFTRESALFCSATIEPNSGGDHLLTWQAPFARQAAASRPIGKQELQSIRDASRAVRVRDYFVFPTLFCKDQPAHGVYWDSQNVGVRPICVWSTAFDGGIDGDFARIVSVIDELIAAGAEPMSAPAVESAAVSRKSL